jgi:hypothetical protein
MIGGIHRQHGDLISLLLFFQNEESRFKIEPINRRTDVQEPKYSFSNVPLAFMNKILPGDTHA